MQYAQATMVAQDIPFSLKNKATMMPGYLVTTRLSRFQLVINNKDQATSSQNFSIKCTTPTNQ